MKLILTLLLTSLSASSFSQTIVSIDTTTNNFDELSIIYTVIGELDSIIDIEINQYSIVGVDTMSLFMGTYNIDEDDPSPFVTFNIDETLGVLKFGIGSYGSGTFYSKIIVSKSVGLPEEFIFN